MAMTMDRSGLERFSDEAGARAVVDGAEQPRVEQRHIDRFAGLRQVDPDAARAERMGAVAFLRLNKADLIAAVADKLSDRAAGTVVSFPRARRTVSLPAPAGFEDPRWADLHKPD